MALYAVILIFSAVYFIVLSDGGILERMNIEQSKKEIVEQNRSLEIENARLRNLLEGYRGGKYPPEDTLHSGYILPGDRVLAIPESDRSVSASDKLKKTSLRSLPLAHLRIAWIALSFATIGSILVYGWISKKRHTDSFGDSARQL